jgi:hypothetical protein
MYPGRWDHHTVLEYQAPITQWHSARGQNNGDLNSSSVKAKNLWKTCEYTCNLDIQTQ